MDKPTVVVMGDVNLDLIAHYPEFPLAGRDALAGSIEVHCGGSAANTAAALSGLGLRARLIARVGREPMAGVALRCLREAGVLLRGVQRDPACATGLIYIIVTPDGERTMLSYRGANAFTDPEQIGGGLFRGARLLHLSGYALLEGPQRSAALRALDIARERGLALSLDPGLALCEASRDEVLGLLPGLDLLLLSLDEARALAGPGSPADCTEVLLDRGARVAAVKLGKEGCLLAAGDERVRMPAFSVQARDTTGAGDAFDAGVIAGRLAGLAWPAAAALGNALGAVAAGRVGAADRPPSAGEGLALMEAQRGDPAFSAHRAALEQAMRFLSDLPAAGRARGPVRSRRALQNSLS